MRVATWLPGELRDQLADLDPAADGSPSAPRPELEDVLARASADVESAADREEPVIVDVSPLRQRRSPRSLPIAVAAAAVLVAGIAVAVTILTRDRSTGPSAAGRALYGVTWLDPASRATLVFQPGTVHVADGCTGEDHALSVSADHLTVGHLIGTSYVCSGMPPPQPGTPGYAEFQQHQRDLHRFEVVVNSGPRWSVVGDELTLTAPDGITVVFTSNGTAPLSLPGSRWKLVYVNTTERHSFGTDFVGPILVFDRHGGFRASDACNSLSGTAEINDHLVQFQTLGRTENHCPHLGPLAVRMMATIDTMFTRTLKFEVENNTLRLTQPAAKEPAARGELEYRPAPAN